MDFIPININIYPNYMYSCIKTTGRSSRTVIVMINKAFKNIPLLREIKSNK
jgi:hypothetical protein